VIAVISRENRLLARLNLFPTGRADMFLSFRHFDQLSSYLSVIVCAPTAPVGAEPVV